MTLRRLLATSALLLCACGGSSKTASSSEPSGARAPVAGAGEHEAQAELPAEGVMERIRSQYLGGIRRCHERVLKRDPRAGGKVVLRFTVGPAGEVTRADVQGFDPTVDACIEDLAGRWRFGVPKKPGGEPGEARFELPLVLQPSG